MPAILLMWGGLLLVWTGRWILAAWRRSRASRGRPVTIPAVFTRPGGAPDRGAVVPDGTALLWVSRRPSTPGVRFTADQVEQPGEWLAENEPGFFPGYRVGDGAGEVEFADRDHATFLEMRRNSADSSAARRFFAAIPRSVWLGLIASHLIVLPRLLAWCGGADAPATVLARNGDEMCHVTPPGSDGWVDCLGASVGDVVIVRTQGFPFRGDVADVETIRWLLGAPLVGLAALLLAAGVMALTRRPVIDLTGMGRPLTTTELVCRTMDLELRDLTAMDWDRYARRAAQITGWPLAPTDGGTRMSLRAQLQGLGSSIVLLALAGVFGGFALDDHLAFRAGGTPRGAVVVEGSVIPVDSLAWEARVRIDGEATDLTLSTWRRLRQGERVEVRHAGGDHYRLADDTGWYGDWILTGGLVTAAGISAGRAWRRRRVPAARRTESALSWPFVAFRLPSDEVQLVMVEDGRPTLTGVVEWVPGPTGRVETWARDHDDGWWHLEAQGRPLRLTEPLIDIEADDLDEFVLFLESNRAGQAQQPDGSSLPVR